MHLHPWANLQDSIWVFKLSFLFCLIHPVYPLFLFNIVYLANYVVFTSWVQYAMRLIGQAHELDGDLFGSVLKVWHQKDMLMLLEQRIWLSICNLINSTASISSTSLHGGLVVPWWYKLTRFFFFPLLLQLFMFVSLNFNQSDYFSWPDSSRVILQLLAQNVLRDGKAPGETELEIYSGTGRR